jgi:hypothetical protein
MTPEEAKQTRIILAKIETKPNPFYIIGFVF